MSVSPLFLPNELWYKVFTEVIKSNSKSNSCDFLMIQRISLTCKLFKEIMVEVLEEVLVSKAGEGVSLKVLGFNIKNISNFLKMLHIS